jgi:hypothetical protein
MGKGMTKDRFDRAVAVALDNGALSESRAHRLIHALVAAGFIAEEDPPDPQSWMKDIGRCRISGDECLARIPAACICVRFPELALPGPGAPTL